MLQIAALSASCLAPAARARRMWREAAAIMSGKSDNQGATAAEKAPHYHGHRARLRQRFLDAGSEAVSDYELLELILFRAIPQRDVKPLAVTVAACSLGSSGGSVIALRTGASVNGISVSSSSA